jgi:hypothetical protein
MSVWSAIAGGFAGTVVLTTALSGASALGLTRMDLPFLLGTALTANRAKARVVGFLLHLLFGLGFALMYFAVFAAIGRGGWLLGALFGVVHALFSLTTLVNGLLPAVHPLMGTTFTAADSTPLLEPPGFLMLNYGRGTPIVTVLAHIAYGAIIGGFVGMSR